MTKKYEYCSTVPRTFVQDCSLKAEIRDSSTYDFWFLSTFYTVHWQFWHFGRYQWLVGLFLLILGSLSSNDRYGYENVTKKVRSRRVKLYRAYFNSFISLNLGEFIGIWILKDSINNQEKKKRVFVLVRFPWSSYNDGKEMYKKAWCTCKAVVLLFLPFSLPWPSSLLKLLITTWKSVA